MWHLQRLKAIYPSSTINNWYERRFELAERINTTARKLVTAVNRMKKWKGWGKRTFATEKNGHLFLCNRATMLQAYLVETWEGLENHRGQFQKIQFNKKNTYQHFQQLVLRTKQNQKIYAGHKPTTEGQLSSRSLSKGNKPSPKVKESDYLFSKEIASVMGLSSVTQVTRLLKKLNVKCAYRTGSANYQYFDTGSYQIKESQTVTEVRQLMEDKFKTKHIRRSQPISAVLPLKPFVVGKRRRRKATPKEYFILLGKDGETTIGQTEGTLFPLIDTKLDSSCFYLSYNRGRLKHGHREALNLTGELIPIDNAFIDHLCNISKGILDRIKKYSNSFKNDEEYRLKVMNEYYLFESSIRR